MDIFYNKLKKDKELQDDFSAAITNGFLPDFFAVQGLDPRLSEVSQLLEKLQNEDHDLFVSIMNIEEDDYDITIPDEDLEEMQSMFYESQNSGSKPTELLINYNEIFKDSRLILFRGEVIQQVLSCLIGKYKPNALLIGASGIGKTRIVENIAKMLAEDFPTIPPQLKGCTIWELPLSALISGSGVVGDVEKKTRQIIDFASDSNNKAILFIDEMHILVSGDKQYNIIGQILKPALARGNIRVIGATTLQEANDFCRDPALNRRFARIIVDELSKEQTKIMLMDMRDELSEHYGGKIVLSRKVIEETIEAADRYRISGSHRPDNAITLLDKAIADVFVAKLGTDAPIRLTPDHVKKTAIKLTTGNANAGKVDINALRMRLAEIKGQDDVIDKIVDCIKRDSLHIYPRTKPLTFLFAGSSGTGKSETAMLIAKELTGSAPITLNMTEFVEKSSISRIVGVHAGYTGSDSRAELPFDILESNPRKVILLDEYEKCCPAVKRLFMSIFECGKLQLANNKVLDFTQAIIIATTNAGGKAVRVSYIGFNAAETESVPTVKELSGSFDIEILNRFSRVLHFHPISEQVYRDIIRDKYKREAAEIKHRIGKTGDKLPDMLPDDAVDKIVSENYNPEFGARHASESVRAYIENILVNEQINLKKE